MQDIKYTPSVEVALCRRESAFCQSKVLPPSPVARFLNFKNTYSRDRRDVTVMAAP